MTRMTGPDCAVMCNLIQIYIHTYIPLGWEDQREWHRMTRMTRPDCAVMCNLINIHTYMHTYIHTYSGSSKICTSGESVSPLSRLIRGFRNKYH